MLPKNVFVLSLCGHFKKIEYCDYLRCVATTRDEWICNFQIRSNNFCFIAYPGLSDTRWSLRLSSLSVLLTKYKVVQETLLSTEEELIGDTGTKAAGFDNTRNILRLTTWQ